MNRIILIILTLLIGLQAYAIKPTRTYSNTPSKMELEHIVLRIETKDGISLNVWHLPSADPGTPIIISQSDAGNMGDWLYLGLYLQAYGLDVWMYDYRGFGESEDFPIVQNQLFHLEFTDDLTAVCEYVYSTTGQAPVLMGISMGSIIVNEYLRKSDVPVSHLVFDGYVAEKDQYSTEADIPKGKDNMQQVKLFDCEHISGFFKYPIEYTESISAFLNNN